MIETPPNVLGIIDDHFFEYVADFGNAGPDKGKGGKTLIIPPGYKGDIPDGISCRSLEDVWQLGDLARFPGRG